MTIGEEGEVMTIVEERVCAKFKMETGRGIIQRHPSFICRYVFPCVYIYIDICACVYLKIYMHMDVHVFGNKEIAKYQTPNMEPETWTYPAKPQGFKSSNFPI